MGTKTQTNPRERILDAAETIFAERGFDAASLRPIVRAARVNLATVHYYYGSKLGLVDAVVKRRFGPLREEQHNLLRQAQVDAGRKPAPLEAVLRAMLLPSLRLAAAPAGRRQVAAQLVGRIVTEPNPRIQEAIRRQHAEVREAFVEALRECLPGLPDADLLWRREFVWGALAYILCNPHKIESETHGHCRPEDTEKVLAEMVAVFAAGFRSAPATAPRAKRKATSSRRRNSK